MATSNGNALLTLLDIAKRTDPDGAVPVIAELLSQRNEILADMAWKEGNLPTGTRNTVRSGLPQAYWKVANIGTTSSKSTTQQIDEACGILEAWSLIDFDIAELNGNVQKYRLTESEAFIESMEQQFAGALFYGDSTVNPERITGLAPRYGAISGAVNAQNILNAGGGGSTNTSVWLVCWGDNTVYGIYPRGTRAGLYHKDFGERMIQTSTAIGTGGGYLHAYVDKWQWKCGLAVKDWRYIVRCANISIPDLVAGSNTQNAQQLIKLMSRMLDRAPAFQGVKPVFYMNRTAYSILRLQGLDKSQNAIAVTEALDQFGNVTRGMLQFQGVPIRRCDQILNTESAIS
jgi:hypothetical protein